jgi:hypothetical protein
VEVCARRTSMCGSLIRKHSLVCGIRIGPIAHRFDKTLNRRSRAFEGLDFVAHLFVTFGGLIAFPWVLHTGEPKGLKGS